MTDVTYPDVADLQKLLVGPVIVAVEKSKACDGYDAGVTLIFDDGSRLEIDFYAMDGEMRWRYRLEPTRE